MIALVSLIGLGQGLARPRGGEGIVTSHGFVGVLMIAGAAALGLALRRHSQRRSSRASDGLPH